MRKCFPKNMFVGLFSITVFQQTHLLPHALCTNPYVSFQIVKCMVSLQNALQCFHWSWKQESWALPERHVSFYNIAFSPFTLFLSMSIRLQVELRAASVFGKKNDTRLPRGVFFFFFLFQDLEKGAGKITNKNQSDLICQMHLVEMNLSLLHLWKNPDGSCSEEKVYMGIAAVYIVVHSSKFWVA